ncbi:MAG: GTP-sensing pleiotropic transcriptional regulator CodY [Clostridiales bacterium]|jgi:transcriptional pleiotropic repressor|nr:GTP-sensing pleiotropic transcriptional regulator CodY [Clostridiales bacterium]
MRVNLLDMTFKLKDIIQNTDFEDRGVIVGICEEIGRQCSANVLLVNKAGQVLANYIHDDDDSVISVKDYKGSEAIDTQLNEQLKAVFEPRFNTSLDGYYIERSKKAIFTKVVASILPTIASGERNGTLVLYKTDGEFSEDNAIMADFCSATLSLTIAYTQNEEFLAEVHRSEIVKSAIGTLSYSELEAVVHIFQQLDGMEGLVVASKIADKVGITRSVIVNALRKLESAGVIESRSLGMKGTWIHVINPYLLKEIKHYRSF